MTQTQTPRPLIDLLYDAVASMSDGAVTLGHFIDSLHERGFGILIFLFALPMAIPVPVPPGVNLLFSTPLLFLTFQQIYGAKTPWLPHFIRKKSLDKQSLGKTIHKAEPWLDWISFFIRPRFAKVTQGRISHLIGVFGFIFALCVCIPVPLTNTVPSLAIALMAIGILMRDGLAILAGMVMGSVWIGLLLTLGISGFKALIDFIFGLL